MRSVLRGVISKAQLVYSKYLPDTYGNWVYLKRENLQVTGAYKIRDAYFKTTQLTQEQNARGLAATSADTIAGGGGADVRPTGGGL